MPRITESVGDIFFAPPNSVLIHACNCRGAWGSGVAKEFKIRFPKAFEVYNEECNTPPSEFHQKSLLGTCLLIPPQDEDLATPGDEGYWIACCFTSVDFGRKVSSELVILESTKKAMADLRKKMKFLEAKGAEFGELWSVRMNSGKFGIPWARTKRILEQCGVDLKVVYPAEEDEGTKNTGDAKKLPKTEKAGPSRAKQAVAGKLTTKLEEPLQDLEQKPTEVSNKQNQKEKRKRKAETEPAEDRPEKKSSSKRKHSRKLKRLVEANTTKSVP
ncbi:ADP-ribose 1''-phosphate phosphatase [Lambiella insularis]|nr:ADP-ribose 1''-phosphate phosphatase [Lambiella insularis]